MTKKSILVFGVGELQCSIINRAKEKGLFVVGIDPCADAYGKELVDAFEVVDGQDYERTLAVARKYNVAGIITAATDKPLVMMARVAEELNLKFYSEDTAIISTDKFLMKEAFMKGNIPCAKGKLIFSVDEIDDFVFPVILKPRDNSGSRGVILCDNIDSLKTAFEETIRYTKKSSVLVEEFIEGKEYSIESLHWNGNTEIIQFTEKRTTPFPYNVELGHIQPADISSIDKEKIRKIIEQLAIVLKFDNCASHTELKINDKGIFVIETSPRLGGDYITSMLVPLSTGVNMEDVLIDISLGKKFCLCEKKHRFSMVQFFDFTNGVLVHNKECIIKYLDSIDCCHYSFKLENGDIIPLITNSLDRYGEVILVEDKREELIKKISEFFLLIHSIIHE
ncbi:MAG: ATP-grasp domain-containing protein [Porphyromonadaceae bacterium]|uniref:ATP-grasp domain-containing protein n=1 Tax=Butyricimonas virosa TaxID=544645 RepID=UPI0026DCC628|nr:ATP-grasp domain-containing protein [Butyricimonas virosa]MBS5626367.1 ATP-grasp domain-containing protein [Porphyromonadaceae bacterium]